MGDQEACGGEKEFQEAWTVPADREPPMVPARVVTEEALRVLGTTRSPRFVWVHYTDLHFEAPRPPGEMAGHGLGDASGYDARMRVVDEQVGRLLDALPPDALVFLTGDHGESFDDAGRRQGHIGLSPEALHVPLLACGPGLDAGPVRARVSLLDLGPTILDAAGLPPAQGFAGQSLWPVLWDRTEAPSLRPWVVAECFYASDGWGLVRRFWGDGFRVIADHIAGLYMIRERGISRVVTGLSWDVPVEAAYLDLVERVLAVDLDDGSGMRPSAPRP
jgi:arylsulfatase A-like enzyme